MENQQIQDLLRILFWPENLISKDIYLNSPFNCFIPNHNNNALIFDNKYLFLLLRGAQQGMWATFRNFQGPKNGPSPCLQICYANMILTKPYQ